MNNKTLFKVIRMLLVAIGLGLVAGGLWGYDPRWGMISAGIGLFLIGIGWI